MPRKNQKHAAPINKVAAEMGEIGATGLVQFSGRIHEEFLKDLQGQKGCKVYREMRDNDPVIGAIMFAIDMLIRNITWRVDPVSPSAEDVAAAEFIESCRLDMSQTWSNFISEVLSFLTFGWSFFEIVYKFRRGSNPNDSSQNSKFSDGKIGWRKFSLRAQETLQNWVFDPEDNGLVAMDQIAPPTYVIKTIPIEKALLFRTTSHKNNPEGRSVLRNAYRPYYYSKRIEEIQAIGIERDLAGLPVMTVPSKIMNPSASAGDQAILNSCKDIVRNIRRDEQEGVIMPSDKDEKGNAQYDIKLLNSGGSRQFDTNAILASYSQKIAMTVLADFILLGHEKVGSYSLSSSKTEIFATALGAWLTEISSVINRYAIDRLLMLNGMTGKAELTHDDIETPDLVELGDYITKLSSAGVELFPDTDLENYLRSMANLPAKQEL